MAPKTADDWLRIQQIIEDCIDRRLAGEPVDDSAILTAHPDLLPELADELRHLAVIERARRAASGYPVLVADAAYGFDAVLAPRVQAEFPAQVADVHVDAAVMRHRLPAQGGKVKVAFADYLAQVLQ